MEVITRGGALLSAASVLMWCTFLLSASPESTNGTHAIAITVTSVKGAFDVEAVTKVAAPRAVVWAVLSDYDNVARFVPFIKVSTTVQRPPLPVRVKQEHEETYGFISVRLGFVLEMKEVPMETIGFVDVGLTDFSDYRGAWEIAELSPERMRITYRAHAEPRMFLARFVPDSALARMTREVITSVVAEIYRRMTTP